MLNTTGEQLKNILGLDKIKNVKLLRVLETSKKMHIVVFNSNAPNRPISEYNIRRNLMPFQVKQYPFKKINHYAPSMYIERYNGDYTTGMFFLFDLAGEIRQNRDLLERIKVFENNKIYEITLDDLKNSDTISALIKTTKKNRNKIMGSETKVTKYIKCEIVNNNRDVDFYFQSKSTEIYTDDYEFKKAVMINDYALTANPDKSYKIIIRIKDFFSYLETTPAKNRVTQKDIKEIIKVADVEIDSEVPFFYWGGSAWYLQQLDATIYKKAIMPPKYWNDAKNFKTGLSNEDGFLDKITFSIIRQISFFTNIMASSVTAELKSLGLLTDKGFLVGGD